jgi:hypothetical protein
LDLYGLGATIRCLLYSTYAGVAGYLAAGPYAETVWSESGTPAVDFDGLLAELQPLARDFLEGTHHSRVLDVPPMSPSAISLVLNFCKELMQPWAGLRLTTQHAALHPLFHPPCTEEQIEEYEAERKEQRPEALAEYDAGVLARRQQMEAAYTTGELRDRCADGDRDVQAAAAEVRLVAALHLLRSCCFACRP